MLIITKNKKQKSLITILSILKKSKIFYQGIIESFRPTFS